VGDSPGVMARGTAPGVLAIGPPGPRWGFRCWDRLFFRAMTNYAVYKLGENRLT
jgi:hypothetical protein